MIQITDQNIERVERILLPTSCSFNDERRKFIRCMESRDVVACPGSGKTTTLLAKILILASKMPFPDNRGICAITHTNAAINIIKASLGNEVEYLFSYPNFFGTIQSFIDRFLAIPAYRNEFKQAPQSIDVDIFNSFIERLYKKTKKAQYRLEKFHGEFSDVCFLWTSPEDLTVKKALQDKFKKLKETEVSFEEVVSIRQKLLQEGVLSYQDMYSLAFRYLRNYPCIIQAMQKRFKFVFLDEAQDTDLHQFGILDQLFPENSDVIVQRLGDPNQAIYHSFVQKEMFWKPKPNPLLFSDTSRFGKTIVKILSTVRIDTQISLKENTARNSLPPHMITYTDDTIKKVLPAFAKIIKNNNLHQNESVKKPIFKAVGWIGKDKTEEGKLCLRFYFSDYRKSMKTRKQYFSNLLSYLYLPSPKELKTEGAKLYKDAILQGIVHAFDLGGLKHPENNRRFTPATFLKGFKDNNESGYIEFIDTLSNWIMLFHRKEKTPMQIRDTISNIIRKKKNIQLMNELEEFLTSNDFEFSKEEQSASNTFISEEGISIDVGTVHSVKGETHTATLFLETYYQGKHDTDRLLPFLKGDYPKADVGKAYHIENLKIAHVAFSRPTHLLAMACHENRVVTHEEDLRKNGWSIIKATDI